MLIFFNFVLIKFPALEISREWGGGFTPVLYDTFRGIYAARCSSLDTNWQFIFSN